MRFGVALPNYGPLASAQNLLRLARHAEERGVDSVWVSDHVIVPDHVASVYPYDRAPQPAPAQLRNLEQFYDALTTLAFIAGATTRVRLGVSVYVVPLRNPLLTAKTVASLDALSSGRVIFGCGVGWLREEFEALHAPFDQRGARTDEYIEICKALWTQDLVKCSGPHYQAPAVRGGPKPHQKPHPPIWIGGNSRAALQRTVRLGDGWHAIDLSPEDMAARVRTLHSLCRVAGRDPTALTVSLRAGVRFLEPAQQPTASLQGMPAKVRDDVAAYAAAGVDYLVLNLHHGRRVDDLLEQLDRIATEIVRP